jgi:hypothetical protein
LQLTAQAVGIVHMVNGAEINLRVRRPQSFERREKRVVRSAERRQMQEIDTAPGGRNRRVQQHDGVMPRQSSGFCAEALASYAKQANDSTLRRLADRIQARAIRREGELLGEIEAATPGPKAKNSGRAPTPNSGRFAASEDSAARREHPGSRI